MNTKKSDFHYISLKISYFSMLEEDDIFVINSNSIRKKRKKKVLFHLQFTFKSKIALKRSIKPSGESNDKHAIKVCL